MGVLYPDTVTDGKMNGSDSFYVRGKQIMSVNTFVREIEGLRIRSKENKLFGGHMLPVVRVENDSPARIRQKIEALKKGSNSNVHSRRIFSSSEDENDVDDPQSPVISSSKTPSASCHTSSQSDGSDSEDLFSDDEVLPDLSEIRDPSFEINRKKSPEKNRSPREHIEKKKKMKKMRPKLFKSGEGKLMKAAKQNWLAKKGMFVISSKDKRTGKNDQEEGKSRLNSEGKDKLSNVSSEHKLKPSPSALHSFKTTGIAELKPYARSPKDVERKSTGTTDTVKAVNDPKDIHRASTKEQEILRQNALRMLQEKHCDSLPPIRDRASTEEQEKLRQSALRKLLQKRMESPPPISDIESTAAHISEKRNSSSELDTTQGSHSREYDSDDTVIYEETISKHTENVLPEKSTVYASKVKRKNSTDRSSNKKLKTTAEPSPGLRFVPSPVPFVVQSPQGSETEGEQHIRIQQVEGGITDAFQSPQSSSSSESKKLKLLKEKMEKKTALEKRLNTAKEVCEANLKREKAAYERRVSWLEKNYKKEVAVIGMEKQKLEDEINSILMQDEKADAAESQAMDAAASMPTLVPLPEEESRQEEILPSEIHKAGPKRTKLLNIISDANINKFGILHNSQPATSSTESSGGSALQRGTQLIPLPLESPVKRKRGRPRLNKTPPVSNIGFTSSVTNAAMSLPPVYSVAPIAAPSKQEMLQTCQNMVVTPDGTIKPPQRQAKPVGKPPPYYEAIMPRMEKVQPNPSNPSVHSPPMMLSPNQSTMQAVSSSASQIVVRLGPSFQPLNQSQINSHFQSQGAIQLPPHFKAQNSSLLFVPSQGVMPASGPVIVNSVNQPIMSDSQRINFLEHPGSDALSQNETAPSYSLPSTTQLPVVSQALSYVPTSSASRANMASTSRPTQHQKSHLLVAAQPSVISSSAAQAKAVPSNQGVIASHPLAKSATGCGETAKPMLLPKANVFGPNDEERSSSPEAEQSCFLCGSPGGFVCCNSIVYCSEECKSKDWGRHSAECAHNNRN